MNLVEFGLNKYGISFKGFDVETNLGIFRDPMFVVRLLTYDEIKRVDRCLNFGSNAAAVHIEDDVFKAVYVGIVGLDEPLDLDATLSVIDAGIVSTLADIVVSLSFQHIQGIEVKLAEAQESLEFIEQIKVILCRFLNTSYETVSQWSIDQLISKYAVLASTFSDVPRRGGQSNESAES